MEQNWIESCKKKNPVHEWLKGENKIPALKEDMKSEIYRSSERTCH